MTKHEEDFLKAYYRACNSSKPEDWLSASLAAKRMYNETRKPEDEKRESEIQFGSEKR